MKFIQTILCRTVAIWLAAFVFVLSANAASVNWNVTGSGASSDSLTNTANWTGGFPANGTNVFMVWTRSTASSATKVVTNAANQLFIADSLTISNQSSRDTVYITLNGQTFLTNGAGALLFAGSGGSGLDISLIFSNNFTFNSTTYSGGNGNNSTLSFAAGTVSGSNLTFNGNSSGVNRFLITAPVVNISSNFTMTGGDANNTLLISNGSVVTVAGRLSVAGSGSAASFTITNSSLIVSNGIANTGRIDILNRGSVNVTRDWTNSGAINISAGGNLISSTGGILTNLASGVITNLGFIKSAIVNSGNFVMAGVVSNNFHQAGGSNLLVGLTLITGTNTLSRGQLDLNGNQLNNSLLVIDAAGILTNGVANATLNGALSNNGTVFFGSETYLNSAVTNTGFWVQRGTISNTVINSGTMWVISNTVAGRITGGILNTGSLTFTNSVAGGGVINSGSFSFSGVISNNYVQTGGFLVLNNTATMAGTTAVMGGGWI